MENAIVSGKEYLVLEGYKNDYDQCDDCDLVGHNEQSEQCKLICGKTKDKCLREGFVYKNIIIQKSLTERQRLTLSMIKLFIGNNGFSPTIKELASLMRVLPNAANDQINLLIKAGAITKKANTARSIVVSNDYK